MSNLKTTLLATALLAMTTPFAAAEGIDDPARGSYYEALEGKTVAYVPVAMGFDLTEGWAQGMREALEPLGITIDIRDPNWSTSAGAQAITSLISEKPDVIVVHNPDVQSYARLLKKAEEAGIYVVQVNMRSSYMTDAFIGADYIGMGEMLGQRLVDICSPDNGGSGKIAITQGVLTAAASAYQMKGISNILEQNPQIDLVSNQAADWDSNKARNIAATVIQQHPDLCAIAGFWDVMDVGTSAAIKESGQDVYLISQGGGNQAACDGLTNGTYDELVVYNVPGQARDISNVIKQLLQAEPEPGSMDATLFTQLELLTRDNMGPGSCWSLPGQ